MPTLIYSTTQALTIQALLVINEARRTPDAHNKPNSSFARCFHACIGNQEKENVISHFKDGKFAVISSTMALGLGQNWKRVSQVIHVGCGDPSTIFQMIGRCGRGGNPGLAILFVEEKQQKGKNKLSDFSNPEFQSNDDQMDALAITDVCLRITFSIDNL